MLRKQRLDDGGIDVETLLIGPAVFLDVWAVRDLSREASFDLRDRFARALKARSGSLLVSSAWVTELDTIKGDARIEDSYPNGGHRGNRPHPRATAQDCPSRR